MLIFSVSCFAYYTTTRRSRELRHFVSQAAERVYYTTTRRSGELRLRPGPWPDPLYYTTMRKNKKYDFLNPYRFIFNTIVHDVVLLVIYLFRILADNMYP